jgi:hypothetical protein
MAEPTNPLQESNSAITQGLEPSSNHKDGIIDASNSKIEDTQIDTTHQVS